MLGKVPQATVAFWLIKIVATTLGETGGDAVTMSMRLGYAVGTAIFAVVLLALAGAQIASKRFRPFVFWAVIVATTTVGTTLADLLDRDLGVGYLGGTTILVTLLVATLTAWHRCLGSVDLASISSRSAEAFYWTTVLFSQTLGTALGDWVADDGTGLGLGYVGGALVFAAGLGLVVAIYFFTKLSRAALFWAAFILTRPLGAMLGDLLDKPHDAGGFGLSRYTASAVLGGAMVFAILVLPQRAERIRPASSSGH